MNIQSRKRLRLYRTHSAITQLIGETMVGMDLTTVWIANTYGSIHNQLINKALKRYHVQHHVNGIIKSFFSVINHTFTVRSKMIKWHILE